MKTHWYCNSLSVFGLTACVFVSYGQTNTGEITGVVSDGTGSAIPNASIAVTNVETGIRRATASNAEGVYTVRLLNPGVYQVEVQQRGFQPFIRSGITLHVNQTARIDFTLNVGEVKESVQVTADAPLLQQEGATLGSLVNQQAVQALPLNGRNFITLAQVTVGANESLTNALSSGNRPDERRRTSAVSINGQRDFINNFMIDGMDNNERAVGTIVVKPSIDALREFRVLTSVYSAEFGRTAGGIISLVTKSGTNQIHGSLFEFFRNDKLDAKNFFDPHTRPIPPFRQNQYGGSIGGPIVKNRTFFFGDLEAFKSRKSETFVNTIPSAQMKIGDFAGINPIFDPLSLNEDPSRPGTFVRTRFPNDRIPPNRLDPIALRYAALYPEPLTAALANNYTYNAVRSEDSYTTDIRVDHSFSDSNLFYARYSFNDTDVLIPPVLPRKGDIEPGGIGSAAPGPAEERAQGIHLNLVHIFGPQLVGEIKAGFSRFSIATLPPNYGKNVSEEFGIPNANVDELSSGLTQVSIAGFLALGDPGFIPIYTIDNTFQYVGSLSYNRGLHSIKTGADFRRRQYTVFQEPSGRGSFSFDANFTNDPSGGVARSGNGMASFLLGWPASTDRRSSLVWPGLRTTEIAGYVQDDWKVKPWLTLSLGARWEVFTPITEVADRIGNIDLVNGKMLVAGRDGVSRTAGVPAHWLDIAPRFGFAATVARGTVFRGGYGINYIPPTAGSINAMRSAPFTHSFNIVNTPLVPTNSMRDGFPPRTPDPTDPRLVSGSLEGVSLDRRTPYVQQYNLTLQQQVPGAMVVSASYVGVLSRNMWHSINKNLALPGPGPIGPRRPHAGLFPNLTNINISETTGTGNYHALQITLERRFSGGLNLSSNYTWAHNIDDNRAQAGGKVSGGPYPQLVNNRSLERGNSDVDIRHRWVLLWNYDLPFGQSLTGVAGLLARGWAINSILTLQSGLNFTVANSAPRANTGGGDRPNRIGVGTLPNPTIDRYIDASAFELQPLFQVGNAGRNILYGPSQKGLDFSIFKDFVIREQMQLQFRTEFFNLTNTPRFLVPNSNFGTTAFGTINSTGNATSRQIQFALKLLF